MKIIIIIAIILCFINGGRVPNNEKEIYNRIYRLIKTTRTGHVERKARAIIKFSDLYALDPLLVARIGYYESTYRSTLMNKYSGCIGIFQISPKHHKKNVHLIQGGIYKGADMSDREYLHHLKDVEINTEIACMVLSCYLKSKGSYRLALQQYGGFNTKYGKTRIKQRDLYIKRIMGGIEWNF